MNPPVKGPLSELTIWVGGNSYSLYDLISHQQYRGQLDLQTQLEIATAAARLEDKDARDLVINTLSKAQYLSQTIGEMKEVFKKLGEELQRADEALAKAQARKP